MKYGKCERCYGIRYSAALFVFSNFLRLVHECRIMSFRMKAFLHSCITPKRYPQLLYTMHFCLCYACIISLTPPSSLPSPLRTQQSSVQSRLPTPLLPPGRFIDPQRGLPLPPLLLLHLPQPRLLPILPLFFLRLLPRSFLLPLLPNQTQPRQIRTCLVRLSLRVQFLVPLFRLLRL